MPQKKQALRKSRDYLLILALMNAHFPFNSYFLFKGRKRVLRETKGAQWRALGK